MALLDLDLILCNSELFSQGTLEFVHAYLRLGKKLLKINKVIVIPFLKFYRNSRYLDQWLIVGINSIKYGHFSISKNNFWFILAYVTGKH